jgi:hypothetical protein
MNELPSAPKPIAYLAPDMLDDIVFKHPLGRWLSRLYLVAG